MWKHPHSCVANTCAVLERCTRFPLCLQPVIFPPHILSVSPLDGSGLLERCWQTSTQPAGGWGTERVWQMCVSHEFSPLVSPDWAPLFTLLCYREKDNTKTRANKYLPTYPHLNNPITDMQSGFSWAVAHVYAQCIWEWTGLSNWMSK